MNHTPSVNPQNIGPAVSVKDAQQIIDAFSKALQQDNCLVQIPIAIYAQADQYQDRLSEIIAIESDITPVREQTPVETTKEYDLKPPPLTSGSENGNLSDFLRDKLNNECLSCNIGDLPELDLEALWNDILSDVQAFVDSIEALFEDLLPNFCHLSFFLSYLCVPDLIRLIAILAAYLIKLMASLFLGTFSLTSFIMGIISAILDAVLKYIKAMVDFAMTPISCILESITNILESIPTPDNLRENLSKEQQHAVGVDPEGEEGSIEQYEQATKKMNKELGKEYKNFSKEINNSFEKAETLIEEAYVGAFIETLADLIGMANYVSCEEKRSGTTIFEKVKSIIGIVQLMNLIFSVIEAKSRKIAVNELCKDIEDSKELMAKNSEPLNANEIAKVIESAFGGVAEVAETEDGNLAILFTPEDDLFSGENVNVFQCDLNSLISRLSMDIVAEEAVAFAEEVLVGDGLDPVSISPRQVQPEDIGDATLYLFEMTPLEEANEIFDIIREVVDFNTPDRDINLEFAGPNFTETNGGIGISLNAMPEGTSGVRNPNNASNAIGPRDNTIRSNFNKNTNTRDTSYNTEENDNGDLTEDVRLGVKSSGFPYNLSNKSVKLSCSSIQDLSDTLSSLRSKE